MDIIRKITEIELKMQSNQEHNAKMIDLAFKNIDLLYDRVNRIDHWNDEFFEWVKGWVEGLKSTDQRQLDLLKKLNMVFYEVFPKVGEAEDTLDRIVDEQRKKPKE